VALWVMACSEVLRKGSAFANPGSLVGRGSGKSAYGTGAPARLLCQLGRRRPTQGNLGGTNATRWTTTTKGLKELQPRASHTDYGPHLLFLLALTSGPASRR
jgi:hypothetical protein